MTLALLVAQSELVDLGKEALTHVHNPHVHLEACVHALGHEPEVRFIQSLMPNTVPGVLVLVSLILYLHVVRVDDGRGEVNQGFLFVVVAAPDLVLVLDVDKILSFQA